MDLRWIGVPPFLSEEDYDSLYEEVRDLEQQNARLKNHVMGQDKRIAELEAQLKAIGGDQ